MNRRQFVRGVTCAGAALAANRASAGTNRQYTVIDTHIHLFDPTRPGGVPWPEKSDKAIFKPSLPEQYRKAIEGVPIVGAIAVEASPLSSDNDWVLSVAANNPIIVGLIGDLIPGSSNYLPDLERLHRNPLFLGIRYGNLWGRDLATDLKKPFFLEGVKNLAQAGLVLESANPDPKLVRALVKIANLVPEQTIIVDHLPHAEIPVAFAERKAYFADLQVLSEAPHLFVKFSEILRGGNDSGAGDRLTPHRGLDKLWEIFGEDRILYGSDWPNSNHVANYTEVFRTVERYLAAKGHEATEKVFCKNSFRAYKWQPRTSTQRLAAEG